jgi:Tfp pilus assembly protein PilO
MSKNATPLILIVLAIGIYFTFTRVKIDELKVIRAVNDQYETALQNSETLVKTRDKVLKTYNQIDPINQDRLDKIVPDNVDNVRLIIDVNGVASRHNIVVKNIKTSTSGDASGQTSEIDTNNASEYNTVVLSFDISTNYQTFVAFLKDLEASLRILEISKITLKATDTGIFDYTVEAKTFWLKQ